MLSKNWLKRKGDLDGSENKQISFFDNYNPLGLIDSESNLQLNYDNKDDCLVLSIVFWDY